MYSLVLALVIVLVLAVWLVRHPLVLLTLNVVPLAWLVLGGPGVVVALLLLLPVVALLQRRSPAV